MKTRRFEQVAALGGMYLAERIIGVDLLMTDIREIESRLGTIPVCDDDAKVAT
jgi:hypothetical protein